MIIYTILIIVSIVIDQFTKYLAVVNLKPISTKPLIQDAFHFTYVENSGAAFSIMKGKQTFLVLFTSFAMAALFIYLVKLTKNPNSSVLIKISVALLIGGGIGNLIDRVKCGYVVDFIDVRLINFAVFNMADVFVVVAVIIMLFSVIIEKE